MTPEPQDIGPVSPVTTVADETADIAETESEPRIDTTRPRILVADPIAREGMELLHTFAAVDARHGLTSDELIAAIPDYDALIVRSETRVTPDVIAAGARLRVIARAGVGVDNIAVEAATRRGVIVVNSPTGNIAAEHQPCPPRSPNLGPGRHPSDCPRAKCDRRDNRAARLQRNAFPADHRGLRSCHRGTGGEASPRPETHGFRNPRSSEGGGSELS